MARVRVVYEGGVLRPMGPVGLREGEEADVTYSTRAALPDEPRERKWFDGMSAGEVLARIAESSEARDEDAGSADRLSALKELRRIADLPPESGALPTDPARHDEYLYGGKDEP